MNRAKRSRASLSSDEVYYPEVVPGISKELDRLAEEWRARERQETLVQIQTLKMLHQQRILLTKSDKYIQAMNTILEKAEQAKDKENSPVDYGEGTAFSIRFDRFLFEDYIFFETFLNKLNKAKCLSWTRNPFKSSGNEEYVFSEVNVAALQKYKKMFESIQFPPGETIVYYNEVLYFKLGDGLPDSIDFSAAKKERKLFECFWNLRMRNPGKTYFERNEVINIYKQLHNEEVSTFSISHTVPNIKKRIRKKKNLLKRFIVEFDREKNSWKFVIA